MRSFGFLCFLLFVNATAASGEDVIYLKGGTSGIRCKVLEVTDDYVLLKIPKVEVIRIERNGEWEMLGDQGAEEGGPQVGVLSRDELGERIREEVRAEAREGAGSAIGQILWDGKPLANCRVRVAMLESSGLFKGVGLVKLETEAITDEKGFFRFEVLTPGRYKLLWAFPGATHWVRRLRMEPDFEVVAKKETVIEPLEVHVRTLN